MDRQLQKKKTPPLAIKKQPNLPLHEEEDASAKISFSAHYPIYAHTFSDETYNYALYYSLDERQAVLLMEHKKQKTIETFKDKNALQEIRYFKSSFNDIVCPGSDYKDYLHALLGKKHH